MSFKFQYLIELKSKVVIIGLPNCKDWLRLRNWVLNVNLNVKWNHDLLNCDATTPLWTRLSVSAFRVLNLHHQASPVSRTPSMPAVDNSYIPPVPPLIQDYRPYYHTPNDLSGNNRARASWNWELSCSKSKLQHVFFKLSKIYESINELQGKDERFSRSNQILSTKACRGQRAIKPEPVSCFISVRWLGDTITQRTHDVSMSQGLRFAANFYSLLKHVYFLFSATLNFHILEISVHI